MIILFILCFVHAKRNSLQNVILLISGIAYGVLLEWATIQQLDAYSYGTFTFMIADVPLMIGVGWGVILYSAMLFSNATKLPWMYRPILDGVLALNIDLAMDAVAIRFGMWDWGQPMNSDYFGVPFENFWAWFWVIFSFSLAFRVLDRFLKRGRSIVGIPAIIFGVIGVMITNRIIVSVVPEPAVTPVIAFLFTLIAIFIGKNWKQIKLTEGHHLTVTVPLAFHIFFLGGGVVAGFMNESPILLILSLIWFVGGVVFHWTLKEKRCEE